MKKCVLLFVFNIFFNLQVDCADHSDRLINAAYAGDLKTVQEIISNRLVSPNVQGSMGTPLLMFAIASGNNELVEYLLDNGSDATVKDAEGRKASARAAANNLSQKLIDRLLVLENAKVETEKETVKTMFERMFKKEPLTIEATAHAGASADTVFYESAKQEELKWNEECFKPENSSLMYGTTSVSNLSHIKRPQNFCKSDFILDEPVELFNNFIFLLIEACNVAGLTRYLKDKELSAYEVELYLRHIKDKDKGLEEFSKSLELDPDGKPQRWIINRKLHDLSEIRNIIESKKKK